MNNFFPLRAIAAIGAALAMLASPSFAAPKSAPENAPGPADCAAPATQKLMNDCAYQDFLVVNADYAGSNKQYASRLSGAQRDLFRRSQSAWIAYRTAACEFESSALQGGNARAMSRWQCASRMTRARVAEVVNLSNCKEGDLSCPRFNR